MRRLGMLWCLVLPAIFSGCSDDPEVITVNLAIYNTGTRPLSYLVVSTYGEKTGSLVPEGSSGSSLSHHESVVRIKAGDSFDVTVTSSATGGLPAATGTAHCTPKSHFVDATVAGRIDLNPGSSSTVAISCVGTETWDDGTS